MIFSGSHFGVINPFHPLLSKAQWLDDGFYLPVLPLLAASGEGSGGRYYWGLSGALDLGWLETWLTSLSFSPALCLVVVEVMEVLVLVL